jgi:2-oxoglutarate/2-oxoacid ferredoxin oxidoreductase subunit beta
VTMHDGSKLHLKKAARDYDPRDRAAAFNLLNEAKEQQLFITGLIYFADPRPTLPEIERVPDTPLALLTEADVRPSREALATIIGRL